MNKDHHDYHHLFAKNIIQHTVQEEQIAYGRCDKAEVQHNSRHRKKIKWNKLHKKHKKNKRQTHNTIPVRKNLCKVEEKDE